MIQPHETMEFGRKPGKTAVKEPVNATSVEVEAKLAERGVEVACTFPAGRISAVVGPNGAGKSTILGLISGLLVPDSGTVRIGDSVVAKGHKAQAPHRRPVAMLTQKPLLFPHLNVWQNVAFGLRARGVPKRAAQTMAQEQLEAVGVADLADRPATALSGGQSQRVAVARALATQPKVVLLDEPFAALDVATATTLRELLRNRLRHEPRPTVIFVTHDPLDVWMLADHVVAVEDGAIVGAGSVVEMLAHPTTRFLSQLSQTNLVAGTVEQSGSVAKIDANGVALTGLWQGAPAAAGTPVLATFTPQSVALFAAEIIGSPRNTWPVQVTGIVSDGVVQHVGLELSGRQRIQAVLTPQAVEALRLSPGSQVFAEVKATQITVYPR